MLAKAVLKKYQQQSTNFIVLRKNATDLTCYLLLYCAHGGEWGITWGIWHEEQEKMSSEAK